MWDQILRVFRDVLDKAETAYLSKAKSTHPVPFIIITESELYQVSTVLKKKTKRH